MEVVNEEERLCTTIESLSRYRKVFQLQKGIIDAEFFLYTCLFQSSVQKQ